MTSPWSASINPKQNIKELWAWFSGNFVNRTVSLGRALKRKCLNFDEIFIIGCTGSCQHDNFQCSQWWKCCQNDDIFIKASPNHVDIPWGILHMAAACLTAPLPHWLMRTARWARDQMSIGPYQDWHIMCKPFWTSEKKQRPIARKTCKIFWERPENKLGPLTKTGDDSLCTIWPNDWHIMDNLFQPGDEESPVELDNVLGQSQIRLEIAPKLAIMHVLRYALPGWS